MQKINLLLLCALVFSAMVTKPVNSGCATRSEGAEKGAADEEEQSGVSDFLHNFGCSLRSGAKKVKDSVESGYNYLKTKVQTLTDDENDDKAEKKKQPENDEVEAEVLEDGQFGDMKSSKLISTSSSTETVKTTKPSETKVNVEPLNKSLAAEKGRSDDGSDDRITFRDDDDLNQNQNKGNAPFNQTIPKFNLTLDDRAALNAPNTCDNPGETRDSNGICRSPTRLNIS